MPSGTLERTSSSVAAATPSGNSTPETPRSQTVSRKSSKPIMEKRRRARINESLAHLKTLILDALKKDSSRHSKLEKADILEMTVKHLRNLQRLQMTVSTDTSILGKYRTGFSECMGEVTRFLSTCDEVNSEVRNRLLSHLTGCVSQMNGVNCYAPHAGPPGPRQTGAQVAAAPALHVACKSSSQTRGLDPEDMKLHGTFQVVPTPDGHFAFLVPSAAVTPVGAQRSHYMSPCAPPVTSDSVWRPW
ncbi:transcription factor HES-1-A-like [Nerophis lumbriciformis]|uniref:transcription factor HES-1-A-like n=1 Tax=Nerophis lumbriciformis TaxID=546530 RepID=UPI002ADFFFE4|nr:transcription factor HES-1-A-like [Nerophis lumbriciformis]